MTFDHPDTLRQAPLVDPFGRAISYLRVSVTDRCDFRCVYCMSENMSFLPKQDLLTLEELDRWDVGPASIRHRVRALGGALTVESQPGQGARLIVRIPL